MTRTFRTIELKGASSEDGPKAGYRWILQFGYMVHVTGTTSALSLHRPDAAIVGIASIDTGIDSNSFILAHVDTVTSGATSYLLVRPVDIFGWEMDNQDKLKFTGDASALTRIRVLEISDDQPRVQTQPTTPTPTVDRGVQWWQ